jgi:hypothetical protein
MQRIGRRHPAPNLVEETEGGVFQGQMNLAHRLKLSARKPSVKRKESFGASKDCEDCGLHLNADQVTVFVT